MSIIEKAIEKLGAEPKPLEQPSKDDASSELIQSPSVNTTSVFVEPNAEVELSSSSTPESVEQSVSASHSRTDMVSGELLNLPLDDLKSKGMLTPDEPRSRVAEEYRIIKRPLLMNIQAKGKASAPNANLIMVTSARPGEGKTFTAINLAISMAMEQDKTVLLVDADVAKASAGKMIGVPHSKPGLIDILVNDEVDIGETFLRTDIPNLRVLPAGQVSERSTELLASQRMQTLMEELSERYPDRVIVFDSPPLLFTTEASVLANLMGQIAFVVAENLTPQHKVAEALSHIGKDQTIGLVLNKSKRSKSTSAYGYGYGYGYGSDRSES